MSPQALQKLLSQVAAGHVTADDAAVALASLHVEDIGFAQVDHQRLVRQGAPEVIFAQGKTPAQTGQIASAILRRHGRALCTRIDETAIDAVREAIGSDVSMVHDDIARTLLLGPNPDNVAGTVGVVTAGTSDIPVAREASVAARFFGCAVEEIHDVGVAGLHRLLNKADALRGFDVLIVVAGMEGALPSVIGGLFDMPIIAVPTSVGYGASFEGVAALLGMLNSCSAGVTVVNIDNGFGAAAAAFRILRSAKS